MQPSLFAPKAALLAILVTQTATLTCPQQPAAPPPTTDPPQTVTVDAPALYDVRRVIDGDTVELSPLDHPAVKLVVRLSGVDTTEVHGVSTPQPFALAASQFTKEYFINGHARRVENPQQFCDRYGRNIAYLYNDDADLSINEELLTAGLAYADHRFPHPRLAHFLRLEQKACHAKIGLWSTSPPAHVPSWRLLRPFCNPWNADPDTQP